MWALHDVSINVVLPFDPSACMSNFISASVTPVESLEELDIDELESEDAELGELDDSVELLEELGTDNPRTISSHVAPFDVLSFVIVIALDTDRPSRTFDRIVADPAGTDIYAPEPPKNPTPPLYTLMVVVPVLRTQSPLAPLRAIGLLNTPVKPDVKS